LCPICACPLRRRRTGSDAYGSEDDVPAVQSGTRSAKTPRTNSTGASLSSPTVRIKAPERIRGATGVGRRGFEPLTSCVSSKAKPSTRIHHEPGKPRLTWDDIPSSSQAHHPHPGPFSLRFLSILLSTRSRDNEHGPAGTTPARPFDRSLALSRRARLLGGRHHSRTRAGGGAAATRPFGKERSCRLGGVSLVRAGHAR
jgi:hypothetical protein